MKEQMLELAKKAMQKAYAPYSRYQVGACLLSEDGRLFTGCNIENASFGMTMCAERVALGKAVSEGVKNFTAIAIAGRGAAPYPCGACRQVLREFAPDLHLLITWDDHIEQTTLPALLPHSFGPEHVPAFDESQV